MTASPLSVPEWAILTGVLRNALPSLFLRRPSIRIWIYQWSVATYVWSGGCGRAEAWIAYAVTGNGASKSGEDQRSILCSLRPDSRAIQSMDVQNGRRQRRRMDK